jgi:hypothetical protein
MTANSFPWVEVFSNAVWICGLAVILAALGWHDYKRRELKERNPKVAATPPDRSSPKAAAAAKALSLMKPVLLGLIMVAGGLALSVRGALLAAAFATAGFVLIFILAKKMLRQA